MKYIKCEVPQPLSSLLFRRAQHSATNTKFTKRGKFNGNLKHFCNSNSPIRLTYVNREIHKYLRRNENLKILEFSFTNTVYKISTPSQTQKLSRSEAESFRLPIHIMIIKRIQRAELRGKSNENLYVWLSF